MDRIKKGSIVRMKSSNSNYIYYVKNITKTEKTLPIVLLKGITIRIETTTYLEDLELVENNQLEKILKQFEDKIISRTNVIIEQSKKDILENNTRKIKNNIGGTILHLDGDNIFVYILQTVLNIRLKNNNEEYTRFYYRERK